MKMIVTGALGHIGSAFIRALPPGRFEEIGIIDNLLTQRYPSLFDLPHGAGIRFYEEDIVEADLDRHFLGAGVVVHLAAITDAESSIERAELVRRVNCLGTERVVQACLRAGCRLLFTSTTSVYGSQRSVIDESCPESKLKPQSPYAETKLAAEQLIARAGQDHGLRHFTGRLGTIFGTSIGMRFHTAVNKFIWQACQGKPVTVWRTAMDQCRPYLDLEDAVRAFRHIIDCDLFTGQTYNIVTANYTVNQILEHIRREVPDLSVNYVDSRIMNQLSYTVTGQKFRDTGFVYQGDLARQVSNTVRLLKGIRRRDLQSLSIRSDHVHQEGV
ncbi:MAG: SDR family oxidoreductase [Candidatus Edwardsbacteria bacterium]|nr:SDR family oxidoreductase [Candidatus Edwardsbacteria bacterium]